jgi:hypothetical protein
MKRKPSEIAYSFGSYVKMTRQSRLFFGRQNGNLMEVF